jgi:hypothetical protein
MGRVRLATRRDRFLIMAQTYQCTGSAANTVPDLPSSLPRWPGGAACGQIDTPAGEAHPRPGAAVRRVVPAAERRRDPRRATMATAWQSGPPFPPPHRRRGEPDYEYPGSDVGSPSFISISRSSTLS